MKNIAESLKQLHQKIHTMEQKFGRQAGTVSLLAVSKTKPIEDIYAAMDGGQIDFAENYVQEAVNKIIKINDSRLIWHFIGPIQSNKTREIAKHFQWVHSLDRLKIAQRLNAMRPAQLPPLNICIQVNISEEPSKSGVPPNALAELLEACADLPKLRLRGLMALPAPCNDYEQQRIPFQQLGQLLNKLQLSRPMLDTLSMGTTHDMEAAIAEGTTMVRIGTAIFGPRGH